MKALMELDARLGSHRASRGSNVGQDALTSPWVKPWVSRTHDDDRSPDARPGECRDLAPVAGVVARGIDRLGQFLLALGHIIHASPIRRRSAAPVGHGWLDRG